jgi:hypothetical protein
VVGAEHQHRDRPCGERYLDLAVVAHFQSVQVEPHFQHQISKILAYNPTVLIAAWYELDSAPVFGENEGTEAPAVLPMARRG